MQSYSGGNPTLEDNKNNQQNAARAPWQNTQQNQGRKFHLSDLWDILVHRWWIMLVTFAVVVAALYGYARANYVPMYQSTASMYICKYEEQRDSTSRSSSDFSLALYLMDDCDYLLKSHEVLDVVIDDLNLEEDFGINYNTLKSSITTASPENTRFLEVTVKTYRADLSQAIVDKVCAVGKEQAIRLHGFDELNIFQNGILDERPCNSFGISRFLLLGFVAAVAVYLIFALFYFLDDNIYSDEDIKSVLGLTVLGDIPNADTATGNKYSKAKYKYRYSKYGKGSKQYGKYGNRYGASGNIPYGSSSETRTSPDTKPTSRN